MFMKGWILVTPFFYSFSFCLFFISLNAGESRGVMSDMLSQKHCEVLERTSILWEDNKVIVCCYRFCKYILPEGIGKRKMLI